VPKDDKEKEVAMEKAAKVITPAEEIMMPKQGENAPEDIIRGPGEGQTIPGPLGITLKATGEQTAGSIGFLEATTPRAGPPRHIHYGCDELFYVVEGQFLFLVGERQVSAPPGTFVFIPQGTVHAAKVIGTELGKVLAAFIPGGQERAFEEFGQLPADVVAEKYDSEFVGPPRGTTSIAQPCVVGGCPTPRNVAVTEFPRRRRAGNSFLRTKEIPEARLPRTPSPR